MMDLADEASWQKHHQHRWLQSEDVAAWERAGAQPLRGEGASPRATAAAALMATVILQ